MVKMGVVEEPLGGNAADVQARAQLRRSGLF